MKSYGLNLKRKLYAHLISLAEGKFKVRLLLYLLFLIIISCSTVQHSGKDKIFMWKITSGKATVYLLGSIHIARQNLYPLDKKIENAFDGSDNLVVEININNVKPLELLKKAMYQDSNTLEMNVSKETFDLLKEKFAQFKIPITNFNKVKPWLAATILIDMELKANGYDEKYGIDKHFLDKADEKRILELETADEQMNLFDDIDKFPDDFVKYSLEDMKNTVENVDELYNAWEKGDTKTFEELMNIPNENEPNLKEILKKLFDDRNKKMESKIENFLENGGKYFVVVGAGHIIGNKGIIKLLNDKGTYKIEQL